MRVFVTGASGFIGSAVVRELIDAGHKVVGLARSDKAAAMIDAAGAEVHRGSLDDIDSLRDGAAGADGVIHLAFIHNISNANLLTRFRIVLGGNPRNAPSRFMGAVVETDKCAIQTLGAALSGNDRSLVIAAPTMTLTPGRLATEENAPDPKSAGGLRVPSEEAALALAEHGIRASVVRLPPLVHGDGDEHGFLQRVIKVARDKGVSAYIGDGSNRWPAVHRLDAARLFRLALEKAPAGSRLHAVGDEGVSFRKIAGIIGHHLNLPVSSIAIEKAGSHFGWVGAFATADNPTSSALTQECMGWRPEHPALIPDLEHGPYFKN